MNVVDLEKKLLSVARRDRPSDKVPYAFEKRIMALLSPLPTPDCWGLWAGALWRAAVPCLALMALLAVWSLAPHSPASNSENLSQEMDNTVLVAIDSTAEQAE
jgi:hypothetical protein